MLSFFPRGVLDEILNLIVSVSEGFPSYSLITKEPWIPTRNKPGTKFWKGVISIGTLVELLGHYIWIILLFFSKFKDIPIC